MNAFGRRLRVQVLGESHGEAVAAVVDGLPPGTPVDQEAIQADLDRRRPGQPSTSARREPDAVRLRSGVRDGKATGAPVLLWIGNQDARSQDYAALEDLARPGRGDATAHAWSGGHWDHRGGGHRSGRITAPIVAAGALVRPLLAARGIHVAACLTGVGGVTVPLAHHDAARLDAQTVPLHAPDEASASRLGEEVAHARRDGDSVGGTVTFIAQGVPPAWGDPLFDAPGPLLAHLLHAMPGVRAVGIGEGTLAARARGLEHNDAAGVRALPPGGGVEGGWTTGQPLWGTVSFKPSPTVAVPQPTRRLSDGAPATVSGRGRHDPCIAVRGVPVVAACVRLVLADLLLHARMEGHA